MKNVMTVISGMGLLIMLFLFLTRGNETVKIINSLAANTVQGIKVLQGRS